MKDISRKSMDDLENLSNQAMKKILEVTKREMKRTNFQMSDRDTYDNFRTFCLLYQSAIINKIITESNAILLGDEKTESKDH